MDNQWKKKFDNAEAAPSGAVWQGISSGLAGGAPASAPTPKYWYWAAAAALFLTGSLVGYQLGNQDSTIENAQVQTGPTSPTEINSSAFKTENQTVHPIDGRNESKQLALAKTGTFNNSQTSSDGTTSTFAVKEKKGQTTDVSTGNPANKTVAMNNAISPTDSGQGDKQGQMTILVSPVPESLDQTEIDIVPSYSDTGTLMANMALNENTEENVAKAEEVKAEKAATPYEYPEAEDFLIDKETSKSFRDNRVWVGVAQGVGGHSMANSGGAAPGVRIAVVPPTLDEIIGEEQAKSRDISENLALNTSLLVGVPVSNRISVVTGLTFNKNSFTSNGAAAGGEILHFTSDPVDVSTVNTKIGVEEIELRGSYDMMVVPVLAEYNILSGSFDWTVQAGPELGMMIRQQVTSDNLGTRTTRPGDIYQPLHMRVAVGTTLMYSLNENFQLSLQPLVEKAVTSITSPSANFESYPLNYSAFFGVRYKIN